MIAGDDRPLAPFGRRAATVRSVERLGPYHLLSCVDDEGPRPRAGQFYMLQTGSRWGGGEDGRPYLPRALSFARVSGDVGALELRFLFEVVGPGTRRLAECRPDEQLLLVGPLGNHFEVPGDGPLPLLAGGGIGVAPVLALADELAGGGREFSPVMLGFRSGEHARCEDLFDCEVLVATEDGHAGHSGYVTDLLAQALEKGAGQTVFACGPPPMLEAVRALCEGRGAGCQLAMESGMACGFGACFGCVVPTRSGYVRLCVDGPVLEGGDIETALVPGSGHH